MHENYGLTRKFHKKCFFVDPEQLKCFQRHLRLVNLAESCPMLNNEWFKLLVLTLDAQTLKTTIKLTIAASNKTY